jgi:hypothetical protein
MDIWATHQRNRRSPRRPPRKPPGLSDRARILVVRLMDSSRVWRSGRYARSLLLPKKVKKVEVAGLLRDGEGR